MSQKSKSKLGHRRFTILFAMAELLTFAYRTPSEEGNRKAVVH